MSCIHYKFHSKLDYNTFTFEGLYLTLKELKKKIMGRESLKATTCDLQITNAQTREEYTDDEAKIERHSSVVVYRIPFRGVKPASRTVIVHRSSAAVVGPSRPMDSSSPMSVSLLAKTANLVDANASEDDKIRAMILQSNYIYQWKDYSKKAVGPPPAHYTCHRCGKPGHYIHQCPMLLDKRVERPQPVKRSRGIPLSFMVKAEPGTKGAMLTSTGEYAVPAIDKEAYAKGKKEHPPFVPRKQSSPVDDADPIPNELLCGICNHLMTDAVVIPCCRNSYCDDCIRTALLDSEEHICFTCKQSDVSPDSLMANTFLRQVVNDFKNEKAYTKPIRKQVQHVALPPPVSTAATAAATIPPHAAAVKGQDVSPAPAHAAAPAPAPAPAPVSDQHSPMHSTGQGEQAPPGEMDPEPTVRRSPKSIPVIGPHGYHFSVHGHPPPTRLPRPSGHQSRPNNSHRGGGRHWERSYRGREGHPPAHFHIAPPSGPAPPVYPSPYLYLPPPQPYPPPNTYGLLPPPPLSYLPQPIYAPGPPGLNRPWIPPGVQPPLPHLGPPLSQPPLSKEEFYRQRHRQDKTTSTLNEFTEVYHKERMKYRNSPKRPRLSYSRSRSFSRSPFSRSRSPCGFQSRPGSPDRWERERYRQCEKEYMDWYNKVYKDHDNQHPSLHHRGRGKRDRERDRMSPLTRDYSPHKRGRRGREERGATPHHPPSSSSSGTKSSTKVFKTKKVKNKKRVEEPEPSHHSADSGDATPVRDELMDEIPSINKTPPISSKPASGSGVGKAPSSKVLRHPLSPRTRPYPRPSPKTRIHKTRKEKVRN